MHSLITVLITDYTIRSIECWLEIEIRVHKRIVMYTQYLDKLTLSDTRCNHFYDSDLLNSSYFRVTLKARHCSTANPDPTPFWDASTSPSRSLTATNLAMNSKMVNNNNPQTKSSQNHYIILNNLAMANFNYI